MRQGRGEETRRRISSSKQVSYIFPLTISRYHGEPRFNSFNVKVKSNETKEEKRQDSRGEGGRGEPRRELKTRGDPGSHKHNKPSPIRCENSNCF